MKEEVLLYILMLCSSFADAIYHGHKRCTFDDGICDGWKLDSGARIVNTTTHNFTVSGNFTQNGSFVFHRSSVLESRILELPTYYRLCYISMAMTLNMTSLEVFPQSNPYFYLSTTTQDEPLIPWSLMNISIPSYTRSLIGMFRNFKLWFIGAIADEFDMVGEGQQVSSDADFDFYIGLDDVTLTYCLPCNFDALNEPENLMLTILPTSGVHQIQLVPLRNVNITLQAFSSICNGQRFVFRAIEMSNELQSMVIIRQLTNTTATLTVTFFNYDIFTGAAQNFTISIGAGIENSNYLGYGDIPMATRTITLTQPGLISTRVPPDPIYYIPEEWISYQIQASSVLAPENTLKYEILGSSPMFLGTLLGLGLRSGLVTGIITNELAQNLLTPDSYLNVTINDSANNKLIKITIPVLLSQLAPTFLDISNGVITIQVREDISTPSVIYIFRVLDPNNDTVSISFGQYLSGPEIFSLHENNLTLNSPLDYETPANYSFTVDATEISTENPLTSNATVIVQVLPANEHTPVIIPMERPAQLVVPQTVVGSFVLQVMATDEDAGSDGVLNYRITRVTHNGAQIPPNIFAINYTTGVITITELLEEGLYSYTITVLVTDMGSPPMTATMDYVVNVIGHLKTISCDFSVSNCDWVTGFRVQNSQASSPLLDYNTNSVNTGGYVFIRGDQIIGGTKIFLTLESINTSVINEIIFVYQLNGSVSLMLQASSQTIWSSTISPGVATGVGNWQKVMLYTGALLTSHSLVNLQFIATGSSNGFAAIDDVNIQVQSLCNYDALTDPEMFSFDLPGFVTIPLNEPVIIENSLTLTECRNEPIRYSITVQPDHLESYFSYADGAINVLGLNSMIASNGTTGNIMVTSTITAPDLFEGTKHFTYNDTVNFVVVSLQQCVITKECSFNMGLCDWQIASPITLTNASAVGVASRNSGQLVSGDYSTVQNLTLAISQTINGSYCRISFYYYATSGIILSVHNPAGYHGELWDSSEAGSPPGHWNAVNVDISYNFDPRVEFDLSFRVSGVGLLLIDDVTLHPCIDCETGCRNLMCPAGEFYNIFDGCQPCPAGHYCLGGTTSAVPCRAGTYNDAERSTSILVCKPCPNGSFSTSGSTDCSFNTSFTCPLGSYPNVTGGVASCVLCQPGSACPTGGHYWPCPEGFTASMPGAVNCTMCPAGYKCLTTSSEPVKCTDGQYSLKGEIDCHDCPKGFVCNRSDTIPQLQTQECGAVTATDDSDSSSKYIIIIIVIVIVALLLIILMTCYIVRLRYRIVNGKAQRGDDRQYAARDGNITTNSTYQPYRNNPRLSKDGMDLTNFSTYHDHEEAIENEGFRDEEVEMTEKNTIKLLVTADEASQF